MIAVVAFGVRRSCGARAAGPGVGLFTALVPVAPGGLGAAIRARTAGVVVGAAGARVLAATGAGRIARACRPGGSATATDATTRALRGGSNVIAGRASAVAAPGLLGASCALGALAAGVSPAGKVPSSTRRSHSSPITIDTPTSKSATAPIARGHNRDSVCGGAIVNLASSCNSSGVPGRRARASSNDARASARLPLATASSIAAVSVARRRCPMRASKPSHDCASTPSGTVGLGFTSCIDVQSDAKHAPSIPRRKRRQPAEMGANAVRKVGAGRRLPSCAPFFASIW